MNKILAGVVFGISVTAANFVFSKNKTYSEYIAKKSLVKHQKWIHIK